MWVGRRVGPLIGASDRAQGAPARARRMCSPCLSVAGAARAGRRAGRPGRPGSDPRQAGRQAGTWEEGCGLRRAQLPNHSLLAQVGGPGERDRHSRHQAPLVPGEVLHHVPPVPLQPQGERTAQYRLHAGMPQGAWHRVQCREGGTSNSAQRAGQPSAAKGNRRRGKQTRRVLAAL